MTGGDIGTYRSCTMASAIVFMLSVAALVQVSNCGHFSGQCHPNFYKTPTCLDTPGAYFCECGAGFDWNSQQCIGSTVALQRAPSVKHVYTQELGTRPRTTTRLTTKITAAMTTAYLTVGKKPPRSLDILFKALSIDSRLDYTNISNSALVSYAVLLGKNFPSLQAFTVGLWLRLNSANEGESGRNSSILSYGFSNRNSEELWIGLGSSFIMRIRGKQTAVKLRQRLPRDQWFHFVCTWNSEGGLWSLFVDGRLISEGENLATGETIRAGGELEVGIRRDRNFTEKTDKTIGNKLVNSSFDRAVSFKGEISYLNMWKGALEASHIADMHQDCTFNYCGDVVEWVDFRIGTRGSLKLRWPSGVFDSCIRDKEEGCDTYCTKTIGPQCKQEFAENIEWNHTPVGKRVSMPCPGDFNGPLVKDASGTYQSVDTRRGYRKCLNEAGLWGEADVSECLGEDTRRLNNKIKMLFNNNTEEGPPSNRSRLIELLEELHRDAVQYRSNPSDITADIEGVRMLSLLQNASLDLEDDGINASIREGQGYTSMEETLQFVTVACNIFDIILDERNNPGWRRTAPRGAEAIKVLKAVHEFTDMVANSLLLHIRAETLKPSEWSITRIGSNFAFHIRIVKPESFEGLVLPDSSPGMASLNDKDGYIDLPETLFEEAPLDGWPEHVAISYTRYNTTLPEYLPNHPEPVIVKFYRDKMKEHLHKHDNLNSVVMATRVHTKKGPIVFSNSSDPISYVMKFRKLMNISNPECVTLGSNPLPNEWEWVQQGCEVTESEEDHAQCSCTHLGVFAITTDMYDTKWRPQDPPRFSLTVASYIGILVSLCLFTTSMAVFIYLRCETDTVAVHRNLAISMICLQLCYFIGITRDENETVCKVFAISIHFFFLSTFAWICNEAFNLYMEVVNSIHADTQQQRPMLRYYIIGYLFPAVLVGAVAKVKWDNYFSSDVCLLDPVHIWYLIGPALGLSAVTVFVLVYTGKAIMESSYSKDREANKIIGNHCKGCWIQGVLMLIAWAFAILSIMMYSMIPQILFAMFNILQGAFFFVFFCVLNGEVVEILAERRSTLGLTVTPSIPRSTKYSVYRRYVPIKALGTGKSKRTQPVPPADTPASPKEARHRTPSSGDTSPDLRNEEMLGVKGHRFVAGTSSGPDSPLIGMSSAQLQRKFKGKRPRNEETSLDVMAIRPPSGSVTEIDAGDIVTTV